MTLTLDDAAASRLARLLRWMSDHGGGERYPNGDCPDRRLSPLCPSCEARELYVLIDGWQQS